MIVLFLTKYDDFELTSISRCFIDLTHAHRGKDALDIFFFRYNFPKWHQNREIFGYRDCFLGNLAITISF